MIRARGLVQTFQTRVGKEKKEVRAVDGVDLDEPTTGLDPQARANLWEHIARLRSERGATVFLTTHYLDEADALSDRIVIIDQGRIVASDTSDNLKAQVSGDLVTLEVAAADVSVAAEKLGSVAQSVQTSGTHVSGRVARAGRVVPGLLRDVEAAGVALESIEVHRPTLDDVFLTLTGRSLRDAESEAEAEPESGPESEPAALTTSPDQAREDVSA